MRPLGRDDVDDLVEVARDPDIVRWTTIPSPYRPSEAVAFIDEAVDLAANDVEYRFAVCTVTEARILGCVALRRQQNRPHIGEVGYWTAPWARRRGVARGGVALVTAFAWDSQSFARLQAYVDPRNVASRGVMARAGFVLEGTVQGLQISRIGDLQDMLLFGLLKPTDEGVVHPVVEDPIEAVRGRFADLPMSSDEMRQRAREDDAAAEARRRH